MKKLGILLFFVIVSLQGFAQGTFSGDLMMNLNMYQRDTNIRASGNPLYDNYLSGSEAWLGLRYNVKGFTFYLRADVFNNSNLKNTSSSSTDFGIGAWSVSKEMKDLTITVGYIYDQIGSGLLFRSFEDRGLLIDNALVGLELKYKVAKNISLKGFTGQIKNNSVIGVNGALHTPPYGPVVKGLNIEGDFSVGKVHILPGIGFINRTLDQTSYGSVASSVQAQALDSSSPHFTPVYNMYAGSIYNTLTYKGFSWYIEGAYKSHETILNTLPGTATSNKLVDTNGNIEYTSLNWGKKGFAIGLVGKRTQNFVMRTSPNQILLDGMMNWQPVVATQRPERLISRYTPASLDISEQAGALNVMLSPNEATNFDLSYTAINTLDNQELYREGFAEMNYDKGKDWVIKVGAQYLEYNLQVYYNKPKEDPILKAITPFAEITYKLNEKRSVKAELQYMSAKQDYGSWAFLLLEYDVAPKWALSVSDMYNTAPNKTIDNPNVPYDGYSPKQNHYYNIFVSYTKDANRFSIAYVKQVDGINCTGGVCRYEPAFSGVKATVTSSF